MKQKQASGHLMALVCVIVGLHLCGQQRPDGTPRPVQLMVLRFVLAYAALWLIHPRWHFHWREEIRFLLMGLFANTFYSWAENTALTLTQASTSASWCPPPPSSPPCPWRC